MTPSTDQAPGEVPRTGARRAMLALAVFLSLAWLYYLFVANAQWQLRLDAAHRQAAVRARELFEEQLATLTEAEAAELRPLLEEGLRRASEDAALKEQHYAVDPALMRQELRTTVAEIRSRQRAG